MVSNYYTLNRNMKSLQVHNIINFHVTVVVDFSAQVSVGDEAERGGDNGVTEGSQ